MSLISEQARYIKTFFTAKFGFNKTFTYLTLMNNGHNDQIVKNEKI